MPRERAGETRSEARLRAILDAAVDAIVTIDEHGVVSSVNPAVEQLFGYAPEEVLGRNVKILMPPGDAGRHDGYLRHYLDTGERRIIGIGREVTARRKDGTTFPVHLSVGEAIVGGRRLFTGILRDITDLKAAENALRNERDFAESLIAKAQAIVVVLDPEGRVVRHNRYLEQLTGYEAADIEGADWFDLFLLEEERDRIREVFRNTLHDLDTSGTVNAIRTKEGRERQIRWSNKSLQDGEGRPAGVLAVGHDVTELRAAQEQLLRSERLAAIGEMLTGLSHESRNALHQMQGCLEALAGKVHGRRGASDLVARLQRAHQQLRQLYDDIRAFASPIHLQPQTCELDRLWRSTWADLGSERAGRDVVLEEENGAGHLRCPADPFAIGQVFRNIFENAIAASPDGGTVTVRCGEETVDGRPMLRIAILDRGPGLNAEQEARIFDPFFTTKSPGTGLGMAIVKRIVDAHGGRITARNRETGGAEILLYLPRRATT